MTATISPEVVRSAAVIASAIRFRSASATSVMPVTFLRVARRVEIYQLPEEPPPPKSPPPPEKPPPPLSEPPPQLPELPPQPPDPHQGDGAAAARAPARRRSRASRLGSAAFWRACIHTIVKATRMKSART